MLFVGQFIESARKRFNRFTEKTRCLVLEEGKVFKEAAHDANTAAGNEKNHVSSRDTNEPSSSTPADLASGPLESPVGKTKESCPETIKSTVSFSRIFEVIILIALSQLCISNCRL